MLHLSPLSLNLDGIRVYVPLKGEGEFRLTSLRSYASATCVSRRGRMCPSRISSAKWQATTWPLCNALSRGSSSWHRSACENGQRVWKRHPEGRLPADGASPLMASGTRLFSREGAGVGNSRQQRPGVGVPRRPVEILDGRCLDDLTKIHHEHTVRNVSHDAKIVRYEDVGVPKRLWRSFSRFRI